MTTPDRFVVQPPLFYMKFAVILLCVAYMGVTHSIMNAMCDESTESHFFVLALVVYYSRSGYRPTCTSSCVRLRATSGRFASKGVFQKQSELTAKSVTAGRRQGSRFHESIDIHKNEIPDDDDDLLAMLESVKMVNPVHDDAEDGME